ncbi:iron complex outermembrane recepter protein [Sphingobium faniae]|nr:iron complex outermembrane recepter protein [Sphingobium faniae]
MSNLRNKFYLHMKLVSAPIALIAGISPLLAQEAPQSNSGLANATDIVVTARRRDESLSKVPLSVAALSGDSLVSQGVRTENDLQIAVPGLQTVNGGAGYLLNFAIRGQTIDGYSGSSSAVLTYINEFQFTAPGPSSFFDIENVQVLKGPQGTLFGRNTTGGAVLYKTVTPGDEFTGFLSARVGSFDQVQLQGAVTIPIVAGKVSLRIAGNHSDGGAYVKNKGYYQLAPDFSSATFVPKDEELGNLRNTSFRGTLRVEPTDTIRNVALAQYSKDDGTTTPGLVYAQSPTPGAQALFDAIPIIGGPFAGANGGLSKNIAWQRGTNRETYTDLSSRFRGRSWLAMNTTEIDLSDSVKVKNIIGWSKAERWAIADLDGSAFPLYGNTQFFEGSPAGRNGQHNMDKSFSEELQLQGEAMDGNLTYTVGGFYSNLRHLEDNHLQFYGTPVPPYRVSLRTRSIAGFAQIGYKITDQLNFTGGFRYTKDKVEATQLPGGAFTGVPGLENFQEKSFKKPSWTVGLDYQVTPDLMVYVTQRGSYRAGGFNFPAVPLNYDGSGIVSPSNPLGLVGNMFNPELARDIEGGAKYSGNLGGMRLTAALSVYNQWIKGVQRVFFSFIPGVGPGLVTTNAPEAQVTGQEFNFSLRTSSWLEVGGQISHTNARFTKNKVVAVGQTIPFGPFAFAPDWAGSAYFQVSHDLGSTGNLTWRGDVYAQRKSYMANYMLSGCSNPGTPGGCYSTGDIKIPGYALVNTRLAWNDIMGSNVTLAGYVKNIFGKQWYQGGIGTSHSFGVDVISPGRPREFGAELRFEF